MKKVDINEAMKFRHPEIVVNVVTKSKDGKVDVAPIGWAMLGSSNPETWAIGVAKKHFTHQSIIDTKEFVVCLPSSKQKKDTLYCGFHSAWKEDKLSKTAFKLLSADNISIPIIDESLACFECKLVDQMDTSDHTIFLGEIVASHVSGEKIGLINIGHSQLIEFEQGKKE
ncbi:TPA: flavin reductase family protein [Candidatus Berkelbacteria bacterium]|uniref:Flavin reductase domain protein FMN-binding protein n=1 Tax=Berkelbacteria bacterium GW2011_GWE1_39_12 TaxID=1618337 RepID=A0A0G4B286_9BACT|nr:MAG: flavin reductase domain protein FMN-binding protein [Berkelbacteria bacterium GW2011_GWE1_39_12]HBO60522.1 flavin reductase family protein [Candidatus Berkelbacteria bacterium]